MTEQSDTPNVAMQNVIAGVTKDGKFLVTANNAETPQIEKGKSHVQIVAKNSSGKGKFLCCLPSSCLKSKTNKKTSRVSAPSKPAPEKKQEISVLQKQYIPAFPVIPPLSQEDIDSGLKTLVLDLDETLVHSAFERLSNFDHVISIRAYSKVQNIYVWTRPGLHEFLEKVGPLFETIVFTASLQLYADPLLDILDRTNVIKYRLFREACVEHKGNLVKDLSRLGRDLSKVVIIDNAPMAYTFHPGNALPCTSWFSDQNDHELLDFIPVLENLAKADDVRVFLKDYLASIGRDPTVPM